VVSASLIAAAPTGVAAPMASAVPVAPAGGTAAAAHGSAQAVNLALATGALTLQVSADGGTKADNDGTGSIYPVTNSPDTALLSGQSFLGAGALREVAEADIDGSSYGCAGVLSPGGALEVGDQGKTCNATAQGTDGVTIDLAQIPGVGGLLATLASVSLTADSLLAHAYDEGIAGTQQGGAAIQGLRVNVALVGGVLPAFSVPVTVPAGPNQPLLPAIVDALTNYGGDPLGLLNPLITLLNTTISGVVDLTANYQDSAGGVLTVSALHVALLSDALATADLAKATVGPNAAPTECNPFEDVTKTNPFCQDIAWLKISGIANGYQGGTLYRPAKDQSRQAMAAFLFRFANPGAPDPACTSSPPFNDIATNVFCGPIQWLYEQGIANGYADGGFHPAADVSRQAGAAFLYRLTKGTDVPTCVTSPFPDVSASTNEFCGAIVWFKDLGITAGYQDGKFHPTAPVTRQAMAAWIHRYSTLYPRPTPAG
jgi:hypothetical protein